MMWVDIRAFSLCFLFLFFTQLSFAVEFEDLEDIQASVEFAAKLPKAFGACGTLISPNWILTSAKIGPIDEVIIQGQSYLIDKKVMGPPPNEGSIDFYFNNQFQLLHLTQPVQDVEPAQALMNRTHDFVASQVESLLFDGVMTFFVAPYSPGLEQALDCKQIKILNFDTPRIAGMTPLKLSTRKYTTELDSLFFDSKQTKSYKRFDAQKEHYERLFQEKIPVLKRVQYQDMGGGLFVLLGTKKKSPVISDMILIGLLGEDRSGQLKIQNLFEIFPHLWLQSTLSENEGPFSPSVYSSYKVGHDYSNVIQKKAFSLGKDFSATAEQIKTHPEYLHKLYPNHFYKAFESSHFYLQLQPSLIRLFDLEAKKTEYESDDGFLDSSTATHLNSHISFQLNKNGEKVAVLTIKSFLNENPNPMGEFGYQPQLIETLLQQVSNEKASLLILDLRENNGGLLAHSKHLLTELTGGATDGFIITNEIYAEAARRTNSIPKNPIDFKTEEHSSELTQVLNQLFPIKFKKQPLSVRKIQILVSKATASAGESTALALREFSGAVIIGQKTTGHVLGSVTKKLAFGFEGHYPIADYISRNGVRIEGVGIQPDIELDPKTDALKFALEL